jgi:hypothetical protein
VIFRRLAAALVAAALTAAVAGCGSDDKSESAATPTRTAAPAETATPTETADSESGDKDKGEDEDKDKGEEEGGAKRDCDEVGDLGGKPKHKLPRSISVVAGARVYESQGPFGKTTRYFAVAKGGPEDLPKMRDKVDAKLKAAGYKVLATDQEEGAEAEGHLSGPHTVDIQVINLCKGKLRIRYTVS